MLFRSSPGLSRTYRQRQLHDPGDLGRAREVASIRERIPVGILYRNDAVPCYEDVRRADHLYTPERLRAGLEAEFDRFTIWPSDDAGPRASAAGSQRR